MHLSFNHFQLLVNSVLAELVDSVFTSAWYTVGFPNGGTQEDTEYNSDSNSNWSTGRQPII
jgi:hypothetical protein